MPDSPAHNSSIGKVFRQSNLLEKIALTLATWFGVGLVPTASGTFGTLATIPLLFWLKDLGAWGQMLTLIIVCALAIWTAHRTQALLGKTDPSEVVIDEVAGFLVTMFLVPLSWLALVLGFTLFRFFDILKPFPAKQSENLKGGLGIVMDDLLAGVYAHLCLRIILSFFQRV